MASRIRYSTITLNLSNRSLRVISEILTFTVDNALNNDTLVDELSNLIPMFGG
jgi:hypothetical protein